MIDALALLERTLAEGGVGALPLAALGGLVMSLNPCCLALYPAAAATCCASSGCAPAARPRMALGSAVAFVLGTATAMTVLGLAAALAGRTLTGLGGWMRYAVAVIPLVMGLQTLGWIRLPMPRLLGTAERRGAGGAFATGLLLSLALGPCGTPILATILSYAAYRGSAAYGAALLFAYGLGVGVPVLLVGAGAGGLARRLDHAVGRTRINTLVGTLLLGLGFYLLLRA